MALARRGARLRREEIRRRDEALRSAEQSTASANQRIQELESDLAKESRARELAEREASVASDHLRDLRVEVARLRDELATVRAEGDAAKLKLARSKVSDRRKTRARCRTAGPERRAAEATLKQNLGQFGTVKETARGFQLILSDSIWAGARRIN